MHKVSEEISLAIRSRYPILMLISWEEERVRKMLKGLGTTLNKNVLFWSETQGFARIGEQGDGVLDPKEALRTVLQSSDRALYVLQDFHRFLEQPEVVRLMRDVAENLPKSYKTLLLVVPQLRLPIELEKEVTVFDIPLPSELELTSILDKTLESVKDNPKVSPNITADLKERICKAARGLTENEAQRVFAKSIVNNLKFDEADLKLIIDEKKQIIRKSEILEYIDLPEKFGNVGGLANLKSWLSERQGAFSEKARSYGLPEPKGLLLLGVQGCGKSLSAKAVASLWNLPLLRLDVGTVFGSYMGQSEMNMRRAIKMAESLSPCVLWLDEIEKGFSGLQEGGSDSGTTKRVLASFLVWLQEKREPVFVMATANSVRQLPPEFLRKGRFDEIFFVDLPNEAERAEIVKIHLLKRQRNPELFDVPRIANLSEGYSGAELEQLIVSSMYRGFSLGREFNNDDIYHEKKAAVALSTTMKEEIDSQREWAKTRARFAH